MNYVYRCSQGRNKVVEHRMLYSTGVICEECGETMWRVPQPVMVNWGGLRPSQGFITGEIKDHIDHQEENRALFEMEHELHEARTANERNDVD